ncbi:hypothetical protein LIER_20409 [Lithospermum erythrorhizon]|uniref:Uncharacterized protein n=1 Tax=Lithospermum erythrorhizon TaxID=34254 RepID=A0AAV3QQG7_LITER
MKLEGTDIGRGRIWQLISSKCSCGCPFQGHLMPPEGRFKLNVDASYHLTNSAMGGVLRDSNGSLIVAFSKPLHLYRLRLHLCLRVGLSSPIHSLFMYGGNKTEQLITWQNWWEMEEGSDGKQCSQSYHLIGATSLSICDKEVAASERKSKAQKHY